MHLLSTSSASLDDIVEPVDLAQPPGDIAVLSFADSDLAGLAAAWAIARDALPSVRLAQLRDLKHPMSVDLWVERVGRHAKVIVVRLLGGLDWWRYGVERLAALARERGIALALLRRLARHAGAVCEAPAPRPVPRLAGYLPDVGAMDLDRLAAALVPGRPVVPIVFHRSTLLAADMAPIDALCAALGARGIAGAPLMVPSLKDAEAVA